MYVPPVGRIAVGEHTIGTAEEIAQLDEYVKANGVGQSVASVAHRNKRRRINREERPTGDSLVEHGRAASVASTLVAMTRRRPSHKPAADGSTAQQTA